MDDMENMMVYRHQVRVFIIREGYQNPFTLDLVYDLPTSLDWDTAKRYAQSVVDNHRAMKMIRDTDQVIIHGWECEAVRPHQEYP